PGFARGIGQRLHLAMITQATAVEHDLRDALVQGALGGNRTQLLRAGDVRRQLFRLALADGRGGGQRAAGRVVDELDVRVFAGATDRHARTFLGAGHFFPDAPAAELLQLEFFFRSHLDGSTDLAVDFYSNYYWTVLPSLRWTCSPT